MHSGVHAKARLAQLSVELEDAEKALGLLGSACDKEAAAHRAEVADLERRYREESRELVAGRRDEISKLLASADVLVREKEKLTADCGGLASRSRASQEGLCRALTRQEDDARLEAVRARAEWDRGAGLRRKAYLASQTEQIRELTVKGLEPEIERLMEKQRLEISAIEAESQRLSALQKREIMETSLLKSREVLREAVRSRAAQAETEERRSVAQKEQELEAARRTAYAAAVERSADVAAKLRRDLEKRRVKEAKSLEEDLDAAQREAGKRQSRLEDRLSLETRECSRRLQVASLAVSMARADDLKAARAGALESQNLKVQADLAALKEAELAKRDAAIDAEIRKRERASLACEKELRNRHDQQKTELRQRHVEAFGDLRRRRSEWLDKRLEAMRQTDALKQRLQEASVAHEAALAEHQKAERACAGPREDAKRRAAALSAELDLERAESEARDSLLMSGYEAGEAALACLKAEGSRKLTAHNRALQTVDEYHDRSLAARDVAVKTQIAALDAELRQITETVELETIKYDHRCKLLKSYAARAHGRQNPASNNLPPPVASPGAYNSAHHHHHHHHQRPPPPADNRGAAAATQRRVPPPFGL